MKTDLLCKQFKQKFSLNFLPRALKSTTMLFLFTILFFSTKTFAQLPQPFICDGNCTSSDVRVLSAYISGPNNMPINCSDANPFHDAQLHLIISSNTQRVGISLGSTLNITDGGNNITSSFNFATCFTDVQLNNGSNNNLVYLLGSTLDGVQCGPGFTLSNVFVSWGTGNTDFCNASANPQCPATPAKCRYKANEVIPVTVKLEVDFSWTTGVCASGGNSLTYDFTPSVITSQNLTFPLTFNWDFGDGNTATTTAASASGEDLAAAHIVHTYQTAGPYTVTLVGSDASPTFSKTAVHIIMTLACCTAQPPILYDTDYCGYSTITAKNKNGDVIPDDELTWSNNAVGNPITVTTTDAVTATMSVGNCISGSSNSVTPAPKTVPAPPVLSVTNNCGSSEITAKDKDGNNIPADELTWSNGATGNPITVTTTDAVTATVKVGDCASDVSNSVTPAPKTVPTAPTVHGDVECAATPLQTITATADETVIWYDASSDGGVVSDPSLNQVGTVTYYAEAVTDGCSSTTRSPATLTIKPLPTVSADNKSVCTNSTVQLTGSPDGGAWTSPYVKSGGSTFDATGLAPAGYQVNYSYTDPSTSCTNSTYATVTVNGLPTVTVSSDISICSGSSTTLTANGATSYLWSPGSGLDVTTGSSVKANPTTTTTYTVTGTDGNTCSNTAKVKVTVNPVPSCTISNTTSSGSHTAGVGQSVKFSGPSGSNFAYAWSFTSNTAGASFAGGTTTATTQSVTVITTTAGSYTLSLKVTDNSYATKCNATCTYAVTVNTGNGFYTYTQGYYSSTGTSCTPAGGTKGAVALIQYALDNTDGAIGSPVPHNEKIVLGLTNHSFTLNYSDAAALVKIMPGGGTAAVLSGNLTVSNVPLKSGKISNVLLSQAITLDLNIHIQGDGLSLFTLKTGYLTTQKGDLSTCPTTKVVSCSKDAGAISSLQIAASTGMKTWIAGKTVTDLLNLASSALGGQALPSGVTLTDVTNAIDAINKSFDGGRFFLGYYTSAQTCSSISSAVASGTIINKPLSNSQLSVRAYPNPYGSVVSFSISASISGKALLEVYDLNGKKLAVVYNGEISSGSERTIKFDVPASLRVSMMYKLTIGDKTTHGLLMAQK